MTQEEAIKVIKDNWPEGRVLLKLALEFLIPELKESEDEKIRKWIKNELESKYVVDNIVNNVMADKALAWLEKQDEKIDVIENFDTEFEKQVSHLIASTINKEYEYTSDFVKWTANALLNYAKHELEKQGEHKCDCKYAGCHVNNVKRWCHKKQSEILYEKCNIKCSEYLKQVEQKPAWSEEDEKNTMWLVRLISTAGFRELDNDKIPCSRSELIDWLKSLKNRVKLQLNQEWSEEEKARIDKIIDVLDWAEEKGHIHHSDWEDYVCYVKSLKPQNTWKPSDGQMKQLGWVAVQNKDNMIGKELMTLYNDLKKLREE